MEECIEVSYPEPLLKHLDKKFASPTSAINYGNKLKPITVHIWMSNTIFNIKAGNYTKSTNQQVILVI